MFGIAKRTSFLFAAACLGALAFLSASSTASGRAVSQRVDVAMNGASFSFEGDVNENGVPAAGAPFVVSGYIYPGGTFDRNGELSGVTPDGRPQFPGQVIGTWTCRGWHLQDGDAQSGPVVVTTQVFDFDPEHPGTQTLVTDGLELAEFHKRFQRAVTGGTGLYRGARGEHSQVYVGNGLNASGGFNTSFDMTILTARD
jgi:hypothetical protein